MCLSHCPSNERSPRASEESVALSILANIAMPYHSQGFEEIYTLLLFSSWWLSFILASKGCFGSLCFSHILHDSLVLDFIIISIQYHIEGQIGMECLVMIYHFVVASFEVTVLGTASKICRHFFCLSFGLPN